MWIFAAVFVVMQARAAVKQHASQQERRVPLQQQAMQTEQNLGTGRDHAHGTAPIQAEPDDTSAAQVVHSVSLYQHPEEAFVG